MFHPRKYVLLLATVGGLVFNSAPSFAAAKTTIPADHYHSAAELFWQAQVDAAKGKQIDVIFIGDSITQGWLSSGKTTWDKYYASKSLDFGISGDTTQNVIWRFENLDLKPYHPKAAVILIGTNNQFDTPEDIATGVKAVLDKTRAVFPGIKVILQSILPNARQTKKMAAANELIKTFADDKEVIYLNLAAAFPPEGDNWKGLLPDKLHLTPEGYEAWAATLNPVLSKFVKIEP